MYDNNEDSEMDGFAYYLGTFMFYPPNSVRPVRAGKVLAVFDDPAKSDELLITSVEDNDYNPLFYVPGDGFLVTEENRVQKDKRKTLIELDDDRYVIKVKLNREDW